MARAIEGGVLMFTCCSFSLVWSSQEQLQRIVRACSELILYSFPLGPHEADPKPRVTFVSRLGVILSMLNPGFPTYFVRHLIMP